MNRVPAKHLESSGNGPPLVFWHGWAANLRVFDAMRAALCNQWCTIAIDLPGHGRSPWVAGTEAADPEGIAVQTVSALLAQMPPQATLIAWSLGGQLALRAALRAPERVTRLVLIGTSPRFLRCEDWPHGAEAATLEQMRAQLARDYRGTVSDFLELQVRGSRDASAVHASIRAATDLRAQLAAMHIPTLVIAGQYDRVTAPAGSAALAALLPQARYLEIPRAAHAPFLSHLDRLLPELRSFLGEPTAAGPAL